MSMYDTTKWYQVMGRANREFRPLVPEPDAGNDIPVVSRRGYYDIIDASYLTFTPERHTVEWRKPKKGERAIDTCGTVLTASHDWTIERWVIVDDEKETP